MRETYNAKTLIEGFKLGKEFTGKTLIAIPATKTLIGNKLIIIHKDQTMTLDLTQAPLTKNTFQDKFGRAEYELFYYEWNPKPLIFGQD
jgi:hypothetical protein